MAARGKIDRMNWGVIVRAIVTAAALCTSAMVSAAEGGVISFIGAVVEPPFEVMTASAEASPLRVAATASRFSADASATTVTFAVLADSRPSATVSIEPVRNAAARTGSAASASVTSVFADGSGHKTVPDRNGEYHVGRAGGTLLLISAAGAKSAGAPRVTVVSQYN